MALDLGVLGQAGLSDALAGEGVLLERGGEGVLAGVRVLLVQELRAGETGAGQGVAEGLGLRLSRGGSRQRCLRLGGGCRGREELDLFADGAAEVLEGLLDVGRVVVGLILVLGAVVACGMSAAACVELCVGYSYFRKEDNVGRLGSRLTSQPVAWYEPV